MATRSLYEGGVSSFFSNKRYKTPKEAAAEALERGYQKSREVTAGTEKKRLESKGFKYSSGEVDFSAAAQARGLKKGRKRGEY